MGAPSTESATSNDHGRRRAGHVVALPYPGRGHINPMLRFCRALAARGVLVTVVVTEEWLAILPPASSLPDNLRLRSIPNVIPSEKRRGADYLTFITAVHTKMRDAVVELLEHAGLGSPVDAIVGDVMLPWAAGIGGRLGVPVAAFFPQPAAVFAAFQELSALDGEERPSLATEAAGKVDGFLRYLPRGSSANFADIASKSVGQSMLKAFTQVISWFSSAHSLLVHSFDELEAKAFDALRSNLSVPVHSIGPCTDQLSAQDEHTDSYYSFLNAQPKNSVVYVSLGSFLPISNAEMQELAMGLKMSGHAFMWVVRDDSTDLGEMAGSMGMVVPWCDQAKVLSHPSVGGFLTHCGWNSTLESISAGVPMLTYPLMWDQYPNSKLIVDDWKVGFRLKDEEEEGTVAREVVAKAVRRLMDFGADENKDMRRRMQELRDKSWAAVAEKGSSAINVDALVHDILS